MIDWHCHILPEIDDGSRSVSESIAMIKKQASDGATTVIATPHFYANDETVDSFLKRRGNSFSKLESFLTEDMPKIILGAEVKYYQGISRLETINKLRIGNTKLLLLEMPMASWNEYMINELLELSGNSSVRIILAHIDRYLKFQKSAIWNRLGENGILMQANADFFCQFFSKRKAISLLSEGNIQFIGSDCHNMTSRPPCIGKAYVTIRKKLGDDYISQMDEYAFSLLAHNTSAAVR